MGWRSNRKGLGIIALFLFVMGVVVPATFGLLTEKAMELGTADLLDKSTNWESAAAMANSTYFSDLYVKFFDSDGNVYTPTVVLDTENNFHITLVDQENPVGSHTYSEHAKIVFTLNSSALENVDKMIFAVRILDKGTANITGAKVWIGYGGGAQLSTIILNVTELENGTKIIEYPIDAIKRLKIQQWASEGQQVTVSFILNGDVNGVVYGARVELYDVKKVNASSAANIMLAVSGILEWVGALAATPYWNPITNREHRNVRRVYRKVRSFRRRR